MSWGLLRPTLRGWRLSAGTTQGDPISVPGPAGPRKAQPLPFWWPTCHNYSLSACHSLGRELTPQSGGSEEAPNRRTTHVHRWSQSGRDTTWRRLGQGVSDKYQRVWQEQLPRLSLFRRHFFKCGSGPTCMKFTTALVKRVDSEAPPQTSRSRISG